MAGPRVVLFYEDATVGGLHGLVRAVATARRKTRRKQPFSYFAAFPRKGNARLVRDCETFADVRFREPHRADHVFAVIDAYEVEKVVPGVPGPPKPGVTDEEFRQYCDRLRATVAAHLRERAMSGIGPDRRAAEAKRFHPHVLFWERETVVLAGAETLRQTHDLAFPGDDVSGPALLRRRNPATSVAKAYRDQRGEKYQKSVDGPDLLGRISEDRERWDTVLDRVPSLGGIIDELVAL